MSLRERFAAFLNPQKRSSTSGLSRSFSDFIGVSDSGIVVNEDTALKLSAVWSCIRLLSELPASLPIEVYQEKGNTRTPIDHPVKDLLMKPNSIMNRFTWHELMNAWLEGWGNAISIIERGPSGYPVALMPVHPANIEANYVDGKIFYKIDDRDRNIKGTYFADEVLHYKMFSTTGFWGKSPIQVAKENIGLGLAAEKFGAKFFSRGGNLKAVIEAEGHMNDQEFVEWKRRWEQFYSGTTGDHTTPILEYGLKYKTLGIPPDQAQFIATRQFQIQEVARIFNVPPHMIAELSHATFSNIEHQDIQFVKYTLRPILRRQEMELEEKLLTPMEQGTIRIRFNLDGLLRGDLAAQTNHIREMVLSGVMSRNEGRTILNLNPVLGGDELYTPANIVGKNNTTGNDK
jgi:HK97 family phage portal protein